MKSLSIAVLAGFFATAAGAEVVTYHCKMIKTDNYNWIAPEYGFRIDTETGAAQAASGHHDWTDAKARVLKNKKLRVLWTVSLKTSQGQNTLMKYQANMEPGDNTVRIRATFAGLNAANRPFGTGTCKTV